MFLSKVDIQVSAHARKELFQLVSNGAYAAHQLLWKLFSKQDERCFLFREEQSAYGSPMFYILSKQLPDSLPRLFNVQSKIFEPKIKTGQRLGFKARINPTICKKDEKTGKSKRHDVMMNAKYSMGTVEKDKSDETYLIMKQAALEWICDNRRQHNWGIEFDSIPDIESYQQHNSQKRANVSVRFSSVDFQGTCIVRDPDVFLNQYVNGFGRAKAFGCGLMLIRKV